MNMYHEPFEEWAGCGAFTLSHFFKGCVVPALFLSACCLAINVISFIPSLNSAYAKWEANKPQNYSVMVTYSSFAGGYNSSQETVRNGALSSSTTTTFSDPAIDRVFAKVRACAFNPLGFLMCKVEYDATYGYPSRFVENDFDLGRIIEIYEFRAE